jgi:hypothetical protein
MSSFIISKKEYIKAAGLVCGVASCSKYGGSPTFCANVKKQFEHIYKLNVYSWCEQYDEDVEKDTKDYEKIFKQYKELGRRIYMGLESKMSLDKLRYSLIKFFGSITYQIENEDANMEAASYLFTCVEMLYQDKTDDVDGFWGSIDI